MRFGLQCDWRNCEGVCNTPLVRPIFVYFRALPVTFSDYVPFWDNIGEARMSPFIAHF